MRIARLVLGLGVALGCRAATQSGTTPTTPPSTAAPTPMVRTRIEMGEPFYPVGGDSALRAFLPDVQPVDSVGECRLVRTGGSGATMVSAYFPSFDSARAIVTLTFDSAGHLVRFSDRWGVVRYRMQPGMSEAQRDSVRRAADASVRSTSIGFDYAIDQAVASNRGGGRPNQAVIGTVRSMENLERLGPPVKRLQRVRRLCGV